MLVLSRRRDEVIYIGNDIRITLVDIRGDSVRIGIEAPDKTVILRAELIPKEAELDGLDNYYERVGGIANVRVQRQMQRASVGRNSQLNRGTYGK